MAISNSYNYATSRDGLISGALKILGVIAQGQTPDSNQVSDAADTLNMLIKAWEAEGLSIWTIKKQTVTLTASTSTYAIGESLTVNVAKPIRIYQAWLHDVSSNVDVPMVALSQEEYNRLGNKTTNGNPVNYYYESLRTSGNLYVYPVPDATVAAAKTVVIQYQAPLADFDASTDEPDIPQELFRALKWNLAAELAYDYGYPQKDRKDLEERAEKLKLEAFAIVQEEASLFFHMDKRGY